MTVTYSVTDGASSLSTPVAWAFGLGRKGQTYLYQYNGAFYESRLSFYTTLQGLDLTTGHSRAVPDDLASALGRRMVRDIIRAQRDRGATVFLNSHLLSEIEITCDQVVFIREGQVVTSRDMRTQQEEAVRLEVRARKLSPECVRGLTHWSDSVDVDEERLTMTAQSRESLPDILRYLVAAGADVYQFTPQRLSLEELFMGIMGEDRGF